jgi:hypothetical protein
MLYKGADPQVVLQRLTSAVTRMEEIPSLVASKKWSAIQGVLTNFELVKTLNQLAEGNADALKRIPVIKDEMYAMASGAERKQGDVVLQHFEIAKNKLKEFVQSL